MTIPSGEQIRFEPLDQFEWLLSCFTTRRFAEGIITGAHDRETLARAVTRRFFTGARATVWGEQVHGRDVAAIAMVPEDSCREFPGVDGFCTVEPGICLVTFCADCPIVYIIDPGKGAVGLVHSGRRGTEQRIATVCLERMNKAYGTSPAGCLAVISPSIGPCCYDVDLWRALENELQQAGVTQMHNLRICTSCHPHAFYSYRRDKGKSGRMCAAVMIESDQGW